MARQSDCERLGIAYDIDIYGIVRSPIEARRFRKAIRMKKMQKKARKANRKW